MNMLILKSAGRQIFAFSTMCLMVLSIYSCSKNQQQNFSGIYIGQFTEEVDGISSVSRSVVTISEEDLSKYNFQLIQLQGQDSIVIENIVLLESQMNSTFKLEDSWILTNIIDNKLFFEKRYGTSLNSFYGVK